MLLDQLFRNVATGSGPALRRSTEHIDNIEIGRVFLFQSVELFTKENVGFSHVGEKKCKFRSIVGS